MKIFNYLLYILNKLRFKHSRKSGNYKKFMLSECFVLNEKYINDKVTIYNSAVIQRNLKKGGLIVFLHYGNFFLTGAAIISQIKCSYTAVASLENVQGKALLFWKKLHEVFNRLYTTNMFLHDTYPLKMIRWLEDGNFLGVALDVHTKRTNVSYNTYSLGEDIINFDNYVPKLARLSHKPVIASVIEFDSQNQKHKLTFSNEIYDYENAIQKSLDFFSNNINDSNQYFHNLKLIFGNWHE